MTNTQRISKLSRIHLMRAGYDGEAIGPYQLIDLVMEDCSAIPEDEDFDLSQYEVTMICIQEHAKFYEKECFV